MSDRQLSVPGIFRIQFEFVDSQDNTIRTEQVFTPHHFAKVSEFRKMVGDSALELHDKLIGALKDDLIIPPPSNVTKVDFQRRKRV